MNSLLDMREKRLADDHGSRGFLPDMLYRPNGSEAARAYGQDNGIALAYRRPLSWMQDAAGLWWLSKGWVDATLIEGTGQPYVRLPPNGEMIVTTIAAYTYSSLPGGSGETEWVHWMAGPFRVLRAYVTLLEAGQEKPPDIVHYPGPDAAASGWYTEERSRSKAGFTADGRPMDPLGPGWQFHLPDLSLPA